MLCQILHIHGAKSSESDVKSDVTHLHAFYLKALEQLAREMQPGRRSGNCAFMFCVDGLKSVLILRFYLAFDIFWQRCFTQRFYHFVEGRGVPVKEKANRPSARGSIVD